MAVMGYLRDRMGKVVAGVIGLSLIAFVGTEVVQSGGSFLRDDNNELGSVGGEKIAYDQFAAAVEQNTAQFKQQSGQSRITPQITTYIQENTWNQFVTKAIIKKEVDNLGLTVGGDEIQSMTSGSNPAPQIVQAFTDPQTGKFDPASVANAINAIKGLRDDDPQKQRWASFIADLINGKKAEKYMVLVSNGLYVNSLEAKDAYESKNRLANFKYAVLPYASIPDDKIKLTDGDYSAYYDENKGLFKNPQELRSIAYVAFDASASSADSAAIKEQINKLLPGFISSTNDSLYVQINAETKTPLAYVRKGELEPTLDSIMFKQSPGYIYGPYISNGSYKVAKLTEARMMPDSVTARHILVTPTESGGTMEKALARADSLKKIIESGKGSFESLAPVFSIDKVSGEKGGDLGTFGHGAMVPEFENAVFNGKKGELKIVTSPYGVHVVQIQNQKGLSKVVKVAVIDKAIAASSNTQSAAYGKAQAFLANVNKDNFDAEAKKAGLGVQAGLDITGTASSIPGLSDARELVRWVYKAKKNDVSEQVFTVGDQYVVAQVTSIKPKGILPLDVIKDVIKPAVIQFVKAKQLTEKFNSALSGSKTIEQVAQKAGVPVNPVQNIVFANPVLPGSSAEYKAVGTVFGLTPNKVSKPVAGMLGVYVLSPESFVNPAPLTNTVREKEQIAQALIQRADAQIFEALKDKANVKDNRAKML